MKPHFGKIKMISHFDKLLKDIEIPPMICVKQNFPSQKVDNVSVEISQKLDKSNLGNHIKPGMRIVITASSRGIYKQKDLLKGIVDYIKTHNGIPYIIPAMGSHGGATSSGQKKILEDYGITEDYCGCEIYSSMETIKVGNTINGQAVYIDKFACESDGVIVFGRIKPHSAFKGPYESGIVKMMTVGLGNQRGASSLHSEGFGEVAKRLPQYAEVILSSIPILCGIGVIENAYDETCKIEVLDKNEILSREPDLLMLAKKQMPQIYVKETDILIVREIGKNISGSGMDPNITGTWSTPYGYGGIKKKRTVILDVTNESHGNIIGLGKADVTTKRAFDKINFLDTYSNVLTSTVIEPAKIPMWMCNDEHAIKAAIKTLTQVNRKALKIVMIKNTLQLDEIYVSEAHIQELQGNINTVFSSNNSYLHFDQEGNLKV